MSRDIDNIATGRISEKQSATIDVLSILLRPLGVPLPKSEICSQVYWLMRLFSDGPRSFAFGVGDDWF